MQCCYNRGNWNPNRECVYIYISLSLLLLPVGARFFLELLGLMILFAQVDVNTMIVVEDRADEPIKIRGRKKKDNDETKDKVEVCNCLFIYIYIYILFLMV